MSNLTIKETNNEKFPYDLRDIQKAVGSTGSHSGFFKDQSKKFDWKEGMEYYEHELKTRKYLGKLDSQFSNNRSIPIAEKHIFITKKAALQVALSLKTPEARALANYLLDRMEANEATLKKIQEIGINNYLKQQDRVNSRNGFTNAIKSNEPNAGPSEYIRYTYAVKSYLGIACNRKKADLSDEELEKVMVAEATATMLSRRNNDMMANVKQSTTVVNDLVGRSTQDLFYDKDYSERPTIKAKIHELTTIIATLENTTHQDIYYGVYRQIMKHFGISIEKIHKQQKNKSLVKLDIIVNYGQVGNTSCDLGQWVLEYLTRLYTGRYNPQALISYDNRRISATTPLKLMEN